MNGKMIGTCGHEIYNFDYQLSIMEYDAEANRVISYVIVCLNCKNLYEKWGIVLHNEQEQSDWLNYKLNRKIDEELSDQEIHNEYNTEHDD